MRSRGRSNPLRRKVGGQGGYSADFAVHQQHCLDALTRYWSGALTRALLFTLWRFGLTMSFPFIFHHIVVLVRPQALKATNGRFIVGDLHTSSHQLRAERSKAKPFCLFFQCDTGYDPSIIWSRCKRECRRYLQPFDNRKSNTDDHNQLSRSRRSYGAGVSGNVIAIYNLLTMANLQHRRSQPAVAITSSPSAIWSRCKRECRRYLPTF